MVMRGHGGSPTRRLTSTRTRTRTHIGRAQGIRAMSCPRAGGALRDALSRSCSNFSSPSLVTRRAALRRRFCRACRRARSLAFANLHAAFSRRLFTPSLHAAASATRVGRSCRRAPLVPHRSTRPPRRATARRPWPRLRTAAERRLGLFLTVSC
eukprot:1245663-Prymnesium_polylepis.1